jgi:FtsH-binding integral membrane protein
MGLIFAGLVQIFFPFGKTADLVYAGFGVLLFSGYSTSWTPFRHPAVPLTVAVVLIRSPRFIIAAVYDTHAIMKRLSPDEYIMGAMSLYLDFINLFLYILRVVSGRFRLDFGSITCRGLLMFVMTLLRS